MSLGRHGYKPGDHWVVCDLCGLKYRSSETRFNYRGALVCVEKCWEPWHPHAKGIPPLGEKQSVKHSRPEGSGYDNEISPGDITEDDL